MRQPGRPSIRGEALRSIARPREFMLGARGAAATRHRVISSCIPVLACFLAVLALSALSPESGQGWRRWAYPFFVLASFPAGCAAFRLAGALLGSRATFLDIALAWGPSYWATDLFLAALAGTHVGAALAGIDPAGLPGWASFAALSLMLCAAIWKVLLAVGVLRVAMDLSLPRAAAAMILLALALAAFALASGLAFGTKIPIV